MHIRSLAAFALVMVADSAAAQIWRAQNVGPWNVTAYYDNGQFYHCIMARGETGTQPGGAIARTGNAYTIGLLSSKWKLETGLSYPVTLIAGNESKEARATVAGANTVSIDIGGRDAFMAALARASVLQVRTAQTTLTVPLERTAEALERLDACFAAERGTAANPFGAPAAPTAQTTAPPSTATSGQAAAPARNNRTFVASAYGYLLAAGQRCPNVVFDQNLFAARMSQAGFDVNGAEEKATVQKELPQRLSMFDGGRGEQECANALKAFGPNGTTIPGMLRR